MVLSSVVGEYSDLGGKPEPLYLRPYHSIASTATEITRQSVDTDLICLGRWAGRSRRTDDMFTIAPPPLLISSGIPLRQQRNVPSRSSDIVWCHTDISTSVTGASWATGVPRIHAELKVQGLHVGHKRVARLISRSDSEYREILANSRKN
jgi:hypothetical protein